MASDSQRPASQKLQLSTVLNSDDHRDSAYYSSNDGSSKHNSTASGIGISLYYRPQEKTPSPTTTSTTIPQPLISPPSNMTVASMVSPSPNGTTRFGRPSMDTTPNGGMSAATSIAPDSRRESVDSRINQGIGDLRLGGGSPYASANHSTTSIHAGLVSQRNPRPGMEHLSIHRISNGYRPSVERTPDGHPKARTAPAITGPANITIARAAEPTKGQAWAFPEEEIAHRVPSGVAQGTFLDSRRSSIASIASSQFTADSRLPPGQRRLEEASTILNPSDLQTVHHHTLQHKLLSDVQADGSSPHHGSQPYSRTPELRVSHKLAERKRRTEMKELFDQLRDLMPQERGSKASKWEILSKAITEHKSQAEQLKSYATAYQEVSTEARLLRREVERLRIEVNFLRGGATAPAGTSNNATVAQQQAPPESYVPDAFGRHPRPELPPLRSLSGDIPSSTESMTGVQYDGQRANSFRGDRLR
ncbi:hypothetical protein F5Y17DRAFT_425371 [Xylariaceae sp. FL0594]|nr:hypothetical protein F5Y17DRAFT_425371 [Xylariaceae sp. FL0594]